MKTRSFFAAAAISLAASSAFAATYNSTTVEQRNLSYNGGPVVSGAVDVYFVFYGNWSDADSKATTTLLMDFTDNIGQSSWFSTLKYYTDSHGQGVTGPLKTNAAVIDNFSQHQGQSDNSTEYYLSGNDSYIKIITDLTTSTQHLGSGIDSHGIYVILTSEEVSLNGFCSEWCGYNSWTDTFLYAVIGHPARCPDACVPPLNHNQSTNGNVYADAMINTLAHEYIDILTDPIGNGYRVTGSQTDEVADFCMPPTASQEEWWGTSGTELHKTDSGAYFNVALGPNGEYKYLIQSIWSPKEQKCVLGSNV